MEQEAPHLHTTPSPSRAEPSTDCYLSTLRDFRFHQGLTWLITLMPPLLLISWMVGFNTKDTARGALGAALVLWGLSKWTIPSPRIHRLTHAVFIVFPIVFTLLMCAYQVGRVYLGDHGIDFAIFTHAIRSVRDTGLPLTTLVAPHEVHFLSHHFAVFLYPLGWLSRITLPPHLIGIVTQFASIGGGICFFFLFCRSIGLSRETAGILSTLLCLHPSFRSGISWGIHDEVFALCIVGAGFYFWANKRHRLVACCLLLATLFKETFFIASGIAAVIAAISTYSCPHARKHETVMYGVLALLCTSLSLMYFVVVPRYPEYFSLSFDASSRIAPLGMWLSAQFLAAKLSYLAYILVPLGLLPLLTLRAFSLWLCAAPFWGASLVSGFSDMHDPFNYYAVVPTFVAFFAAAKAIRERPPLRSDLSACTIFIAICIACSAGYGIRPLKPVRTLSRHAALIPESLAMIPQQSTVVASDFDLVFILDKKTPVRQWMAERNRMRWDILLARKPPKQPISEKLREKTRLCYEDAQWQIFCRPGISLPPNTSAPQ